MVRPRAGEYVGACVFRLISRKHSSIEERGRRSLLAVCHCGFSVVVGHWINLKDINPSHGGSVNETPAGEPVYEHAGTERFGDFGVFFVFRATFLLGRGTDGAEGLTGLTAAGKEDGQRVRVPV